MLDHTIRFIADPLPEWERLDAVAEARSWICSLIEETEIHTEDLPETVREVIQGEHAPGRLVLHTAPKAFTAAPNYRRPHSQTAPAHPAPRQTSDSLIRLLTSYGRLRGTEGSDGPEDDHLSLHTLFTNATRGLPGIIRLGGSRGSFCVPEQPLLTL